MSNKDRSLLLKFMSGDSRINPEQHYSIDFGHGAAGIFPEGHTCGLNMCMPYYDDKESMKKNMLIAFRMCGEIDLDGGSDRDYGEEDDRSSSSIYRGEGADNEDRDSNASHVSINLTTKFFPIYRIGLDINDKKGDDDDDNDDQAANLRVSKEGDKKDEDAEW